MVIFLMATAGSLGYAASDELGESQALRNKTIVARNDTNIIFALFFKIGSQY